MSWGATCPEPAPPAVGDPNPRHPEDPSQPGPPTHSRKDLTQPELLTTNKCKEFSRKCNSHLRSNTFPKCAAARTPLFNPFSTSEGSGQKADTRNSEHRGFPHIAVHPSEPQNTHEHARLSSKCRRGAGHSSVGMQALRPVGTRPPRPRPIFNRKPVS